MAPKRAYSIRAALASLAVSVTAHADTVSADAVSGDGVLDSVHPNTTVVWISLDGFRWDYTDRADTPNLDRLMREGAYTRAMAPAFPSLTFPTHVSLVTGVPVSVHGIPANGYYDRRDGDVLQYPADASRIGSEPIWITAERQGVRAAVFDWPVSHNQVGEVTATYFNTGYNPRIPDEPRMLQPLEAWADDSGDPPLRLVMGYAVATDSPGHRYGPDAPEMTDVIREADALVGRFVDRMLEIAQEKLDANDELYLIITTDHGMSTVHWAVSPELLLGLSDQPGVEIVSSGNIANIYLPGVEPESERQKIMSAALDHASCYSFAHAWRLEDIPDRFGYQHADTVGDVVVMLDRGYIFSTRATAAIVDIAEVGGPLGMHGYDVESNPDMYGFSLIWRYPEPIGGHDLGRVGYRSIHPTVAAILRIEPAPNATGAPLKLEPAPGRVPATGVHDGAAR